MPDPVITAVDVSAYTVPVDGPDGKESDGTLEWTSTTMVVVEVTAGDQTGLGYTYAHAAAAQLIVSELAPLLPGRSPFEVGVLWREQVSRLRNVGVSGLGAMAVSAVDVALWDLEAKLVGLSLHRLLNPFHDAVPIYGSGGFCNYPMSRLTDQLADWVAAGIGRVKLKTSRQPEADPARLAACRAAIGAGLMLMTDANGALDRKQALYWAHRFRGDWGVAWFEEPVASVDRQGLRLLRDQGPPGLDVAAGEYGSVLRDFVDLLPVVDCLQADVTRCGGITGLLEVAGLCAAHRMDLSAHCAPALSAHAFCAVERVRHLEYFHDHVRIEEMFFDGVLRPHDGELRPDPSRTGLGLVLKRKDAEPYLVFRAPKG